MVNPKKPALLELLKFLGSPFNFLILSGTLVLALFLFVFSVVLYSGPLIKEKNFSAQYPVGADIKARSIPFSSSQLFSPEEIFASSTTPILVNIFIFKDANGNGIKDGTEAEFLEGIGGNPQIGTLTVWINGDQAYTGDIRRFTKGMGTYTGSLTIDALIDMNQDPSWQGTLWSYYEGICNDDRTSCSPGSSATGLSYTDPLYTANLTTSSFDYGDYVNIYLGIKKSTGPTPSPSPPPPTPQPSPTPPPPPPTHVVNLNIVSFSLSKNTLLPGESVQANITIGNPSTVAVSSQVALYKHSASRPSCNQTTGQVGVRTFTIPLDGAFRIDGWTFTAPTTPGNYTAWVFVDWTCGTNETSEQDNWASVPYVVTQNPQCDALIGGLKFNDRNGNGQKDANDEGLSGFNFSLVKDGRVLASTVSGNDGRFSFGLRPCGTYTITETPRVSWQPTTPTSITRYFGVGPVLFGNKIIPPSPTACDDVNGDGVVNMSDIGAILVHMSPAPYDSRYDVNHDQRVDMTDVYLVLAEVGRVCRSVSIPDPNLGLPNFQCEKGLVKATLSWYPPTSVTVSSYIVQISTNLDFNDPKTTRTYSLPGTITSHTLYPLSPKNRYYWRIIARTADGRQSSGNNISQFITPSCPTQGFPTPTPIGPLTFPSPPPLSLETTPSLPSLPQPPPEEMPSLPQYTYPQLPSLPQFPQYPYPTIPPGGIPQIPGVPVPPPTEVYPGLPTADSFPPSVQILTPQEKARVSREVAVQISTTDNVGVSSVEIYVNDQLRTTFTKPPYTWIWNVDQEPEIKNTQVPFYCRIFFWLCRTSFVISVKAYDVSGNIGADSVLVFR
jgi:hypothetical protein